MSNGQARGTGLRDAAVDLLLGGHCVGCGLPGRLLCRRCRASLPATPVPALLEPHPPGLATVWAAAEYDGLVRQLVVGHKEHHLHGLRSPLGDLLTGAVLAVLAASGAAADAAVVLVPVPSRGAAVRSRGHDATGVLARRAAASLRCGGHDAAAWRLLRPRPGLVDQAGLDASARAANLAGSLTCPSPVLGRLARRRSRVVAVVCDDVVTSGATAREAQRALEGVGLRPAGIAAVATTRLRSRQMP